MLTLNELKDFNVEKDREDTMYLIEVHTFRRGYSGWIETTGDPVIFMSDSKEETCQRFAEIYGTLSAVDANKIDRYSRIDLMKAFDIFNGMVEYMAIGGCNTRSDCANWKYYRDFDDIEELQKIEHLEDEIMEVYERC